ncbi:hypothetical protein TNCT_234921 [Trichonephila clavata]|uniref:Uncharacterized protein n=1 Tax=Trichonephila clavata TaxID=2740835 RepID=A0A8X6G4H6_TRICU|nr:hypothetical protein TNCT_234921 [Trichonephila clavata]
MQRSQFRDLQLARIDCGEARDVQFGMMLNHLLSFIWRKQTNVMPNRSPSQLRGDKRQEIGMPDAQIPIPLTPFQITWTCIDVCHLDLFLQVPQKEKVVSQILTECRWGSDRDVSGNSISVCI